MDYLEYRFNIKPENGELVLAFLSQMAFEMFEEEEGLIKGYLPEADNSSDFERDIDALVARFGLTFTKHRIPAQNWNAVWESNFQPIHVGQFCGIRADFHAPLEDVKYEILINPRMAFGTGHHATTYMMIDLMRAERFRHTKVLDYGCGTGILAILAAKQGAQMVDAVDIEKEAYENAIENAQINNVDNLQVYHGKLDVILDQSFDIILANINRNVILNSLPTLYEKLKLGGVLLISGILIQDREQVKKAAVAKGFTFDHQVQREDWTAMRFLR